MLPAGSTSTTPSPATSGGWASGTRRTTTSRCCWTGARSAARPFYLATPVSPDGVRRRRHIKTLRREVIRLDDEVLDLADAGRDGLADGLTGEAVLLAALNASRTGQMSDIVETIQVEQDWIIRSPHKGVLVVQGGPGTGKTAVALHRAAFLLYTYREQLARAGGAGHRAEPDLPALRGPGAALRWARPRS